MSKLTPTILALFLLSHAALGAVYYVDSRQGADRNSGTSASNAWRTLAPVNRARLNPGDSVLFLRGGEWRETLTVGSSGTADHPVTYGAYGEGPPPLINGEDSREYDIRIEQKNYVRIAGLQVANTTGAGIHILSCEGCKIENNLVANSAKHGLFAEGKTRTLSVVGNEFRVSSGWQMAGSAVLVRSDAEDSLVVADNRIDLSAAAADRLHPTGIIVQDVSNAIIRNNTISGSSQGIGVKALTRSVTGIEISGNLVSGVTRMTGGDGEAIEFTGQGSCEPESCGNTLTVSGNIFKNYVQGAGATTNGIAAVHSVDSAAYRNVIIGPLTPGGSAFHWSSACMNDVFYNNTIFNADIGFAIYSTSTATIKNNIIYGASRSALAAQGPPRVSKIIEDNNLFFPSDRVSNPAQITRGGHSMVRDPQFLSVPPSTPSDLAVGQSSPAARGGASLGNPYELALDPRGKTFPYPSIKPAGPTIGAFAARSQP